MRLADSHWDELTHPVALFCDGRKTTKKELIILLYRYSNHRPCINWAVGVTGCTTEARCVQDTLIGL